MNKQTRILIGILLTFVATLLVLYLSESTKYLWILVVCAGAFLANFSGNDNKNKEDKGDTEE